MAHENKDRWVQAVRNALFASELDELSSLERLAGVAKSAMTDTTELALTLGTRRGKQKKDTNHTSRVCSITLRRCD